MRCTQLRDSTRHGLPARICPRFCGAHSRMRAEPSSLIWNRSCRYPDYASVRTLAHSRKRPLPCALHNATLYVCMTHGGGLGSQLYCAACPHTSLVTAQLPPGSTLKPTPAAPRSPCDGIPHTAAALRASPRALSRLHVNARACPRRDWSRSAALPHDAQLATLALKHPNLVLVGDSGVGGGGGRGAADAARTGAPSLGAQPHVPPSMCALVAAQHC